MKRRARRPAHGCGRDVPSLRRTQLLARSFADGSPEPELVHRLADLAQRELDAAMAWVLLHHESDDVLLEATRLPAMDQGPRLRLELHELPALELAAARSGTWVRRGHPLSERLTADRGQEAEGGSRRWIAFAPAGDALPLLVLVLELETAHRLPEEASCVQLWVDAAAQAMNARRLAHQVESYKDDAERDFLTGIFNRRLTMRLLERQIRKARRDELPLSLMLLDVDNFKSFNDTFGHLAGDEVLREIAQLIARTARASDVVGRFGGEEFLVVLPETSIENAVIFAERLRQDVERSGSEPGARFRDRPPTISIGVCAVNPRDTVEAALARCDAALYESKHRGRNCFSLGLSAEEPS